MVFQEAVPKWLSEFVFQDAREILARNEGDLVLANNIEAFSAEDENSMHLKLLKSSPYYSVDGFLFLLKLRLAAKRVWLPECGALNCRC